MTNSTPNIESVRTSTRPDSQILILADVCFEMFAIKELRKPHTIIDEIHAAFPEMNETDILKAISMALNWRRLLRAAGRPLH